VGLEAAAQLPFAELLEKNVFRPAGMTTAYAEDVMPDSPNAVGHYIQIGLRSFRLPDADNSYKVASGGLVASPKELVYLGNRLLDGTLISPETRELLFSPAYVIDSADGESYGLGFEIESRKFDGLEVLEVGHGGSLFGGRVSFVMYPDYSLTVAVAVNANPSFGEAESGAGRSPARIARSIASEIISALEIGTFTP
jgi:CubicO group peptidase (beta-lactamase class C family)